MAKLTEESSLSQQDVRGQLEATRVLAILVDNSQTDAVDWAGVARAGKALADGLRSEEFRTVLGEAGAPAAVGKLLEKAVRAGEEGQDGAELLAGRTELARVVGNLCFEHDVNRQLCLDADIPASLTALLAQLLGLVDEGVAVEQQRVLSVLELKYVRATVGALLNMSLKFDPVRRELTKSANLRSLIALLDSRTSACKTTAPIYTVGCWAVEPVGDVDEWEERLQVASMTISWGVNVLEDVLNESKAELPPSAVLSFSSALLPIYTAASHPSRPFHFSGEEASDYLDTDIELLSVSAALLEGTLLDLDSAKLALAFSTYNPSLSYPSSTLLEHLVAFIKSAFPPPYWAASTEHQARTEKAFSTVKAAVVRAVVEAPNSDEVMQRLWKETKVKGEGGKSWLVEKMVLWLEEAQGEGREDILICAAHLLAGMGRKDEHTESLVHEYGLAGPLARIVQERVDQSLAAPGEQGRPGETTQILFGVVSLLRHLAIPVKNRQVVGETGVINSVAQLLRKELDIVGPLQLSSIGLLKHLTASNIPNSLQVVGIPPAPVNAEAPSSNPVSSPLDHILVLVSRTDDTRLRSEATRIVVNLVRSLFSTKAAIPQYASLSSPAPSFSSSSEHIDDEELLRSQGRGGLVRPEATVALSELVRLSEKYPMLINEGIVALALLAGSSDEGASLVLSSLLRTPKTPTPPPSSSNASPADPTRPPSRTTSLAVSPAGDPPCAADMLATWIGLVASNSFPTPPTASSVRPEMVANAVALVVAVLQRVPTGREDEEKLRVKVVGPLKGAKQRLEAGGGWEGGALKTLLGKAVEIVEKKA
ncbi:hypothetical protein JCM8547_003277 [Rhodosporidiobolus lusitaniae]